MQPAYHSRPSKVKFEVSEVAVDNDEEADQQDSPYNENVAAASMPVAAKVNTRSNSTNNSNNKGQNHVVILKEPSHTCFACPKAFNHKWMLDRHLLTHTGEEPFACSICLRRFSLQASCLRHVRHVHKNVSGLLGEYVVKVNELQNNENIHLP